MSERIKRLKFEDYPWSKWCDNAVHHLHYGVDYDVHGSKFAAWVHRWARHNGCGASVRTAPDGGLLVQIVKEFQDG